MGPLPRRLPEKRPATLAAHSPFITQRRNPRMNQALNHNRLPTAAASHWLRTATMAAGIALACAGQCDAGSHRGDRKSTRLNSSHQIISYAVFCLKKKKKNNI